MIDLYSKFRAMHSYLRQIFRFTHVIILVMQVLALVVFPIAETILLNAHGLQDNYVLYGIYGLHVLIGSYVFYVSLKLGSLIKIADIDQLETYVRDLSSDLTERERQVSVFASQLAAIQGSISVLRTYIAQKNRKPNIIDIEGLLRPLIVERSQALDFKSDDKYNFVVYVMKEASKKLEIYYRDCDNRIQKKDRSWAVGKGHVGIAYASGSTIILPRSEDWSTEFFLTQDPVDKDNYASLIAVPIIDEQRDVEQAMGVLVITSSRGGHFTEDYRGLAESYGAILSSYFTVVEGEEKDEKPK